MLPSQYLSRIRGLLDRKTCLSYSSIPPGFIHGHFDRCRGLDMAPLVQFDDGLNGVR